MLFYVLITQFQLKQLSIADFAIVAKDGLFWLSIVTSPQLICEQGSTLRAVRLSRTGKNVENGSLDRLFYNATCPKGQVKNRR